MTHLRPSATPNPNNWGTNMFVIAIVSDGDTVYIGGQFTYVGPSTGAGLPLDISSGEPVEPYPRGERGDPGRCPLFHS